MNNSLKSKLKSGILTIGSWITLGHPAIAEILAANGYDWLVIDLEHSTISIQEAGELIRIIDLCGVAPLVRLTSNNPDQIKRLMDAGAEGIIVPNVNNAQEAAKAVQAVYYAPNGNRGVGLARAQGYGKNFKDYLEWQKENSIVIVQIEHRDALNNLESIFSTPGVDGFIIGPYDLSCSLGIPGEFEKVEFKQAINFILNTATKMKIISGLHIVEPNTDLVKKAIKDGYGLIAYSVDIRMLDCISANISNLKKDLNN